MTSALQHVTDSLYQNSIADSLYLIVDTHMDELRQKSPFFQALRQGKVTAEVMASMLHTIIYALRHTPVHLQLAEYTARQQGMDNLAAFFREKYHEEYRHEDWALDDLRALPVDQRLKDEGSPLKGVTELMSYLEELIKINPLNYLGYIFLNEHIAATVFPEIIEQLEKKCGIDRIKATVLTKHMELDQQHSKDDRTILEKHFAERVKLVDERRAKAEFMATLYQSLAFYEQMFTDFSNLILNTTTD